MNVAALRLSAYFGESLTIGTELASNVIVDIFARHRVIMAALFRGLEGYGASRRIRLASFPDISTDLPLVATAVDAPERIAAMMDDVDRVLSRGLVTLEHVRLIAGEDLARTDVAGAPGRTVKLSVHCGRGERLGTARAHRAIVDLLQRQGLPGATVLLGVDGLHHGVRQRARLFGRNRDVPMIIAALGSANALKRVLPLLAELFPDAHATLEEVVLLKHDGEPIDPFPLRRVERDPADGGWQSVDIYSRRNATHEGRAIYAELTRQLRRREAAGVTTIQGEWGYSSEETPHGDKLWTTDSYLPTYTRYIDHSQKVREVWPLIDELTSEHGIVTTQFVAAYRERTTLVGDGQTVEFARGHLALVHEMACPTPDQQQPDDGFDRPVTPLAVPYVTDEVNDSDEARWLVGLTSQVAAFAASRGQRRIAVRVSLVDGEEFFLAQAEPSPGGGFVTLYPHPKRHAEVVRGTEGEDLSARALVIPLTSIRKIELLPKVPRGARSLVVFDPWARANPCDC